MYWTPQEYNQYFVLTVNGKHPLKLYEIFLKFKMPDEVKNVGL